MNYVIVGALLVLACAASSSTRTRVQSRDGGRSRGRHAAPRERGRDFVDDSVCHLEISCGNGPAMTSADESFELTNQTAATTTMMPVRLPIRGPSGPRGPQGDKGDRGVDGLPGLPGPPGGSLSAERKVAFFVGLTENFGPVTEHTDIVFDRIITNIGSAYNVETGRFTAPSNGVYQFNVVISAQGRQKAAVMVLKNGEMVATVWAESIPYWSTASNVAVLSLERGDQVWLLLLSRASYLHGYMYTTFSGSIVFTL